MYGYVRPDKGELKVREYEAFRSAYCGLCHSLKKQCGLPARFLVSYDLPFLSILLHGSDGCRSERKRCIASPLRRRTCVSCAPAQDETADYGVILACWQLRDSVADEGFFRGLPARAALLLLSGAYRRARRHAPAFDRQTRENLSALRALEKENCPGLDRTADCFAAVLRGAAEGVGDETRRRILGQLFYHIGRMVYILDAADDLGEDVRRGRYNPLRCRFTETEGKLTAEQTEELRVTLQHSQNMAASAFQLLDESPWTGILENIVYRGLPQVSGLVLAGQWKNKNSEISRKRIGVNK
jgi:hypothetical protein